MRKPAKASRDFRGTAISGTHTILLALDCPDARREGLLGFAFQRLAFMHFGQFRQRADPRFETILLAFSGYQPLENATWHSLRRLMVLVIVL